MNGWKYMGFTRVCFTCNRYKVELWAPTCNWCFGPTLKLWLVAAGGGSGSQQFSLMFPPPEKEQSTRYGREWQNSIRSVYSCLFWLPPS